MSIFEASPSRWTGRMLSILRIMAGLAFFTGGTMKVFGFPPFPTYAPPMPMPPMWEFHVAGWLETYLGLAFTLGLFTRPISFILAGEMAVSYFLIRFSISFLPPPHPGLAFLLYFFL